MGGSSIRSEKFGAPKRKAKSKLWRGVCNSKHKKLGLHASSKSARQLQKKGDDQRSLFRFKQDWTFADIATWTDKQAEKFLRKHGVLGPVGERLLCWQCDAKMQPCSASSSSTGASASDVQECPNCRDSSRHKLQVSNASLAYSPFWASATRGNSPRYKLFLRTAHALGVEIPVSAVMHQVPDKKNPLGEVSLKSFFF